MPDGPRASLAVACLALAGCSLQSEIYDPPITCNSCERWNQPQAPFHIYGNTYYVGTGGLSSILIVGESHILIDAGLPQSAQLVAASIRELGFDPADISTIAVSHTHYDHVGGVAAMQRVAQASGKRATRPQVVTSLPALDTLRSGRLAPDDPQYDPGNPTTSFPAVPHATGVADGVILHADAAAVRGIYTPGHTAGGMSWTWQACEDGRCLDVVYADSLGPVAASGYRFSDGMGEEVRRSAARVGALACDIFLSTHDFSFGLQEKFAQGRDAFIDSDGCERYAASVLQSLEKRLAREVEENPR